MAGSKGIVSNQFYTFSAANRTITFTNDYAGLDLGEITYITNIKNGVATVIYDPFDATKGGTLSGLTLTLAYNTTTMADTDPLQVIVGMTPQNADPQLVKVVPDVNDNNQTDLLQNISDNLDFLNLSLDQNEGIQMNTRDINGVTKKDTENAIILSDGAEYRFTLGGNTTQTTPVIDTKGYQSALAHFIRSGAPSVTINGVDYSNDGINWFTGYFTVESSGPGLAGTYANLAVSQNIPLRTPLLGRYLRFTITPGLQTVSIYVLLKNTPWIPPISAYNASNTLAIAANSSVNVSQINGSAPSARSMGAGGSQSPTIGGIFTAGPQNHGENTVGYPVIIGGREAPYIGNLAGITRVLQTDSQGRYILGGDYDQTRPRDPVTGLAQGPFGTAPVRGVGGIQNNIVGAQSLTVSDTNQSEGDTDNMLLKQILQELKILNQQLTEIPFLMNAGQSQMSDPQEYRDDKSTLF